MVQDSGKTLRTDTFKPVNLPEPVRGGRVRAQAFRWRSSLNRRQAVTSIEDRWRIDDEWWRSEPVSRLYYAVLLGFRTAAGAL